MAQTWTALGIGFAWCLCAVLYLGRKIDRVIAGVDAAIARTEAATARTAAKADAERFWHLNDVQTN